MSLFSKTRPAQSDVDLFRTPEMDEEDARGAGVQLASDLSMKILAVADFDNVQQSEPARSQMVFEANFFAAASVAYHAGRWYSQEPLRTKFLDGLKGQFALILAVATDSMEDAAVRSEYESLLADRQQQYQAMLVSRPPRRFRFLRESVDRVFLAERTKIALRQHSVSVANSVVRHFVSRVVRVVHSTCAAFTGSPSSITRSSRVMRRARVSWVWMGIVGVVIVIGVLSDQWRVLDKYLPALNKYIHSGTPTTQSDVEYVLAHLGSDADRLNNLCLPYDPSALSSQEKIIAFVKDCRAQTLAARPILDDLHIRFQQFKTAWGKETAERSVPADCRNVMQRVIATFEDYLSVEDQDFEIWQSMNPDSPAREELANALRRSAKLQQEGVAATLEGLKGTDEKLIRDACAGY
jgi:hypothetical protein